MTKYVVTGAAGFIGSALVDDLLARGGDVVGVDNFATGKRQFVERALASGRFSLHERDLLEPDALLDLLSADVATVFHLAASADVRFGPERPRRDLEQTTIVTWNVLEAMRRTGARRIAFSSTGSVYGEAPVVPTPETCPFPIQTSLYGAAKVAAEGLIEAYAESYGISGVIFRFVSILGERYQHGHVLDFTAQLARDPTRLRILGDGSQRKSYLYIQDCLEAMNTALSASNSAKVEIYNLGTDEIVTVNDSVDVICEELGVRPRREYTGGDRGWVGDNPLIFLDCAKIRALGWRPNLSIRDSVRRTVRYLLEHRWLLAEAAS
jgi:UDP-glucose 4-epimerase